MDMDKTLSITIKNDLAEKFELALKLNKENVDDVIQSLIVQYVSDSFYQASIALDSSVRHDVDPTLLLAKVFTETEHSNTIKITKEMVRTAYTYAKKVYFGELTQNEGKLEISRITGMNTVSAQDYLTDFLAMMEGKRYYRILSNYATEYFIASIKKDFGEKAFQLALEATEKHIKYFNSLGYGQLKAKEKIVKSFKES